MYKRKKDKKFFFFDICRIIFREIENRENYEKVKREFIFVVDFG